MVNDPRPRVVAAPIFYEIRAARRRYAATRVPAPDHVRARRHTLRCSRRNTGARTSCTTAASTVVLDAPGVPDTLQLTPPGPTAPCFPSVDILSAASEGIGAFHAAQRAVLSSQPRGFASFLDCYLALATSSSAITSTELLPMPRPFAPPSGRPPRSARRCAGWAAARAAMQLANQAAAAVS